MEGQIDKIGWSGLLEYLKAGDTFDVRFWCSLAQERAMTCFEGLSHQVLYWL